MLLGEIGATVEARPLLGQAKPALSLDPVTECDPALASRSQHDVAVHRLVRRHEELIAAPRRARVVGGAAADSDLASGQSGCPCRQSRICRRELGPGKSGQRGGKRDRQEQRAEEDGQSQRRRHQQQRHRSQLRAPGEQRLGDDENA